MDCSPAGSSVQGDSPGKNTGMSCHALLQEIFPAQGSNPGLPHCRQILYYLSHQGSSRILEWVAYPFYRGTSQPRNWTRVSCIAGGFFASWATSSVQSLSHVQLFAIPWTAACQASLSITNSQSLLKLMPIELVMPSNHLILCCPFLFLPSIFPSIRVFSNELGPRTRGPKYWSFSFSISPSNEYSGLISFRLTGWISLQAQGLWRVFSSTTVQKHQFFRAQLSLWSNSHIHTWLPEKP